VDLPGKATPCLISSIPASLTPGCTSRTVPNAGGYANNLRT
jgi:peroxiredoxin